MDKILILEDHEDLRKIYADVLGPHYEVESLQSLTEFKDYLIRPDAESPSLFLADISLPDGTLLELIRSDDWFARFKSWPTIVVSAADDIATLEACYTSGVVDYLTKPFNRNELLVKCRRVLGNVASRPYRFSPVSMTVTLHDRASDRLTAQESKIFHFLSAAGDDGVTKRRLMEEVWGEPNPSKKLDVHISRLRKKLQPLGLLIDFRVPDRLFLRVESPSLS
jgi:DNA-binding response OmpR family regulator